MTSNCCARIALLGLILSGAANANTTAAPTQCTVPVDRLLRRYELELPGLTRVTRAVDVPADAEILIEAYETGINARIEARDTGADVAMAESALHRWPPHRLIVAKGPARKVDVTLVGMERSRGKVDVRVSRLTTQGDRRCPDFWRAMASGDAAYARGAMIFRAELDAPPGASEKAYETAVAAYARAVRVIGDGGLDEAQARLVHSAILMTAVERFPEALEAAALAEARFKALGHEFGRDLALFHWAYSLAYEAMRTPNPAEAKRKFETSGNTFRDIAASHLRRGERFEHALAIDGLACVQGHLFQLGDAIASYQHVLDVLESLNEPDRAVAIRYNLAYFEGQFGRNQEALKRHLEILAEGENVKDPSAYVFNIRSTAFVELKLGKYDAALRHYSDAYALSLRMQSFHNQQRALYGLGLAYHAIGNFGEAESYLQRSLDLRPEQQAPRERGITLRTLANVLGDLGRDREAIARREDALKLSQIPLDRARITLELVDEWIDIGDLATAKSLLAPLLAARDLSDPGIQIGGTLAGARIALAEGNAKAAARDARTAADYYRSRELVSSEFEALLIGARAACATGAREEALDIAHAALQRAEEVRTFSSNPTLRASLWRPLRPAFGFTVGVLARAKSCGGSAPADPIGALAIAEASRGRALEDFRVKTTAAAAQSKTNERRRELFEQLAGLRQQQETLSKTVAADDARLEALRSESARLRREIDLSGGLPASSRLRADDLRPELRARIDAIPADTAVVEYWLGKDEAFAWLLTRGRAQLVDLGRPARIDTAARRFHDAMHSWVTGSVDERIARSRELHELIIAPLPAELTRARTVYFIPDGMLHAVPFAALAHGDAARPRYFVDAHDVAVAPAFLAIAPGSERPGVSGKSAALVVVDPVYTLNDVRFANAPKPAEPAPALVAAATTLRGSRSWARLPATASEAATITKLLEPGAVRVLSGFDASRDSLLGRDLARYDILHFATHAVADTEAPQLSALVLSTLDAQGKPRVGEVFAGDLADQRLGASLVVLSGCETALGRAEAGEGLLGLRYAAHASGARTVIASLWPVMDAAGAKLMDDLYGDVIGRKASPVAALSRAMRAGRSSWKDPALWAAFDVSIAGF